MRFALVGIGNWGKVYIKNLSKIRNGELVATCSQSFSSFDTMPTYLKSAPHFTSFTEMLRCINIDTVIIATHPNSHFNLSMTALHYGKNIICEKPCMFTEEEYLRINELLGNKVFYTDYTNIHHNVINKMRDIINLSSSKVEIELVNVGNGPTRMSYSDIYDYGSHILSIIYHLYPESYIHIDKYENDKDGNHIVEFDSSEVHIKTLFGNSAHERIHTFSAFSGELSTYWSNNKSENPLLLMLQRFCDGKLSSNISLSRKIMESLKKIESLNKLKKK